jgi:hypothetical protein
MSVRKLLMLGLLTAALIVMALFAARAQARPALSVQRLDTDQTEFAPPVQNRGWWNAMGFHTVGNDNYLVGWFGAAQRDFFTFDASLLGGCARSATLQIPRGVESGEFGGATTGATLLLHDVSTDALTLNTTTGPNPGIFTDLGTGAVYGSRFFPTAPPFPSDAFIVNLNEAALQDLNSAVHSGGFFSIGGMLDPEPAAALTFLFASTQSILNPRPVTLLITTVPC